MRAAPMPYCAAMSRAGLFSVMTVGMATIAGTVLALYATILEPTLPGAAGHLIVASVIGAPAALMIAALMVPEEGGADSAERVEAIAVEPSRSSMEAEPTNSSMDAITQGTREGI